MNENLNTLLYACKRIGILTKEVEQRISLIKAFSSEKHHRYLKQTCPNIEDVERYVLQHQAMPEIKKLQWTLDVLANDIAALPRDVKFPKAIDMYNEFRKEAKK